MIGLKRLFDHITEMVNNDQIPKVRDPESGVIYGYFDQAFGLAMNAKKEVEAELELNKAKLAAVTKERDQLYKLNQEFAEFAKRQGWQHVLIDEFYALTEKGK